MSDIIEKSVRAKNRFVNPKPRGGGVLSTEELYDLDTPELEKLYGLLSVEYQNSGEKFTLRKKSTSEGSKLKLKLEVVEYIHNQKELEKERNQQDRASKEKLERQRDFLLSIKDEKEREVWKNKNIEEIDAALAEL